MSTPSDYQAKLVLLGSSGVGKSSIIYRFVTETFRETMDTTLGAVFMSKLISVGDDKCLRF